MAPSSVSAELDSLLAAARPLLREEYASVDERLPSLLAALRDRGAGENWHKDGNFVEHLYGTYRTLKQWGAPPEICRCGLFHSAYATSYLNHSLFDHDAAGRDLVRGHIGVAAERLVHLFHVAPRQKLVHDVLLARYSDEELVEHVTASSCNVVDIEQPWRKKLSSLLPAGGVAVKRNAKTGEEEDDLDLHLSRRAVALLLLFMMADYAEEMFSFQDEMYENSNGRMDFSGGNFLALWPGEAKPGLWVNMVSRAGALYNLIVREEQLFIQERKMAGGVSVDGDRDEEIELVVPPIFDHCMKVLGAEEQVMARDKYWEAVCGNASEKKNDDAEKLLVESLEKNPFLGDPYLVLGQVYLGRGKFEAAERAAAEGLELLLQWGTPWDKRVSWEGWVAWGRVLLMKAQVKSWPPAQWAVHRLGARKD
ncbi:unnamed protein product [Linum trigynum]|uniref:DUF6817 domain-containing protein n=1 Tax=Linum trigynum TaxID=586398 RepID=A0AAV2D326_9ROSI